MRWLRRFACGGEVPTRTACTARRCRVCDRPQLIDRERSKVSASGSILLTTRFKGCGHVQTVLNGWMFTNDRSTE